MTPAPRFRRLHPSVTIAMLALVLPHAGIAGAAAIPARATRAPSVSVDGLEPAVDSIAAAALEQGPLAGMSIAVAHGSRVVLAKGYGVADLVSRRPVSAETVFPLCSISKHVTAAAVLRLVEAHRARLSDRLGDLLPAAPRAWSAITLRQLLSHTSGLGSYNDPALGWDSLGAHPLSHGRVLALVADRPPAFAPGTSWSYSNTAFYLAGMIVERQSGRAYGDYVHDIVGAPQGAPSLRAVTSVDSVARAHGYRLAGDRLAPAEVEDWANPFAGGGLAATASDLARWESRQSKRADYADMIAPTHLTDGMVIDYGLGTRLGRLGRHRMVGHTGNGNGFNDVVLHFPEDALTVVVLANSESRIGARSIATRIARRVLDVPGSTTDVEDLPVPSAVAAADTGTWIGDNGAIEVFARADRLRWRGLGEPGEGRPLPYMGDASFRIGPETVARFDARGERARWTQVYGDGLFQDAVRRRP